MDFKKYKYFYVNGTSHVEGGGLEEPELRDGISSARNSYEKIHNVTWKNRTEVNFGKRLSEIIGIPCINEAKCGGSLNRIIRKTYDFIYQNWSERNKFFIILEKPDPFRTEVYDNELKKYFIVNSDSAPKERDFLYATLDYYGKENTDYIINNQSKFKEWHNRHFCYVENLKETEKSFVGLYSFCKLNNIKIFVMNHTEIYFKECFNSEDVIKLNDVLTFCKKHDLIITNETYGEFSDYHPGYFGHIEYAKELSKILGWEGEYPNFPEYKRK
jgi:hypothetical protein